MGLPRSISSRISLSVLLMETVAALVLIAAVAVNAYETEQEAFDANLRASANVLLSAVQETTGYEIKLDSTAQAVGRDAVYVVKDAEGHVLGARGTVPDVALPVGRAVTRSVDGRRFRLFTLAGDRIIDPDDAGGGHHPVLVVFGQPEQHVWEETMEATRFFVGATLLLQGVTAVLLVWLLRRLLRPIRDLAEAASAITPQHWEFAAPRGVEGIAELAPLQAALRKTLQRLRVAFEQRRRFTWDAAHELKTDTAIIKSSLQLLTLRPRTNEEYEDGVSKALDDVQRMQRSVEKMLTLARLEQGDEPGEGGWCCMEKVAQDLVQRAGPLAEIRGIAVVVDVEAAEVGVEEEDATLLLSNLLQNALQYSPDGGVVQVVGRVKDALMEVLVLDDGPGFPKTNAERLLEPFARSDDSRARKSGSTGLGLSICKAICERAGGTIALRNHPGGGAEVQVVLPARMRRVQDSE